MQNQALEIETIKKFIKEDKQSRFIQFVSSVKTRDKLISELAHFKYFKFDKLVQIKDTSDIITALSKTNIDTSKCYIISENPRLDTKILSTKEAIKETVGYGMGTILIFGNASIIFYEGEEMNHRYISKFQ